MSLVKSTLEVYSPIDVTDDMLRGWFDIINKEVFGGVVPLPEIMTITPQRKTWGYVKHIEVGDTKVTGLMMLPKYPNLSAFIHILAHEMIHVWQLKVLNDTGNHNKHFYSWRDRFSKFGLELKRTY